MNPLDDYETIDDAWQDYSKRVIPPNACYEQRTQTKDAFYAGCAVVWSLVIDGIQEIPEDPDNPGNPSPEAAQAGADHLHRIHAEISGYAQSKIQVVSDVVKKAFKEFKEH